MIINNTMTINSTINSLLEALIVIGPLLGSIAYVTIAERKVMGSIQRRIGPNKVGYYGLLQAFADALKLLVKELVLPSNTDKILFVLAPMISLVCGLLVWTLIPYGKGLVIADFSLGIVTILAISSVAAYGIILAGWASNNKYSFIGSLRATAQLISYEVVFGLIILLVIFFVGSFNLTAIIESQKAIWYIVPLFPIALMFLIAILAESNRAPFDLPESESELTAGFMTEYSAFPFVFFFLAEYGAIVFLSTLSSILFLGGYLIPGIESNGLLTGLSLGFKTSILLFILIWIRASFPRLRYDQLMAAIWCNMLPVVIAFSILIPCIIKAFEIY